MPGSGRYGLSSDLVGSRGMHVAAAGAFSRSCPSADFQAFQCAGLSLTQGMRDDKKGAEYGDAHKNGTRLSTMY